MQMLDDVSGVCWSRSAGPLRTILGMSPQANIGETDEQVDEEKRRLTFSPNLYHRIGIATA